MTDKIEVTNPYSGQSAMLTEEENKQVLKLWQEYLNKVKSNQK